jgi:hypothetical protein
LKFALQVESCGLRAKGAQPEIDGMRW